LAKLNQENVADILGISQSNYSRIENDEIEANEKLIEQLATVFKVNPEQLIEQDDAVNFNNCDRPAYYKQNTIHNYSISEELKNLYEDKIKLLEDKLISLENKLGM
jgi:transcriptional regulator with XRE-family HTH domain